TLSLPDALPISYRRCRVVSSGVTITQTVTRAADSEAFFIKQMPDTPNQQHFVVLIIATVAASLKRFELGKFLFPIAQNMWLHATQFADFTNGEITLGGNWRQGDGSFARAHGLIWV